MTAVQDGPTSIRVSWTPSSDATGYRIHYTSVSDSGNEAVSNGSTETHTLTGLVNGETYTISVVATSDNLPSESVTADMAVGLGKFFSEFVFIVWFIGERAHVCLSRCISRFYDFTQARCTVNRSNFTYTVSQIYLYAHSHESSVLQLAGLRVGWWYISRPGYTAVLCTTAGSFP